MKKKIAGIVAALIASVSLTALAGPASATVGCSYSDPDLQYACNLFEFDAGRDFDFTEASYWAGIGQQYGHTVEALALDHSAETDAQLVDESYNDVLGRDGEPGGIAYWTNIVASSQLFWENLFGVLGDSSEGHAALNNDQFTTAMYELFLLRDPSADELAYWNGVQDSVNRLAVTDGIGHSDEASARLITQYFNALLGRAPTDADLLYWSGIYKTYGLLDVVALLQGSDEAFAHISQVSAPVVAGSLGSSVHAG